MQFRELSPKDTWDIIQFVFVLLLISYIIAILSQELDCSFWEVIHMPTCKRCGSHDCVKHGIERRSPILEHRFGELSYGCGSGCHAAFFMFPLYTSSGCRPARD